MAKIVVYDMNRKQVVTDANGRNRWDQDRSWTAAEALDFLGAGA